MMSSTSFSVVTSFKGLTGKGFADFGGNTGISIIGNCVSAASQPEVGMATFVSCLQVFISVDSQFPITLITPFLKCQIRPNMLKSLFPYQKK